MRNPSHRRLAATGETRLPRRRFVAQPQRRAAGSGTHAPPGFGSDASVMIFQSCVKRRLAAEWTLSCASPSSRVKQVSSRIVAVP
ncbi:hypothetical protein EFP20_09160 [Burkholderia glumae]|nr:hypothetical protein EFP20_09160 [Burkholderia glumae]